MQNIEQIHIVKGIRAYRPHLDSHTWTRTLGSHTDFIMGIANVTKDATTC